MKETINTAFLFNLMFIFFTIIMVLVTSSLSYSKAFKIKNRIVEIIELHQAYNNRAKTEIDDFLRDIGYKIVPWKRSKKCTANKGTLLNTGSTGYNYCVYGNKVYNGTYYVVEVFIYFDFPIINDIVEIPVFGETKIIYDLDEI